jgi:hypothetical protein
MGLKASLYVVKKSRQCTYNRKLWSVCETYVAVEITATHSLCVVELRVTANYIKILSVAQHCFYGRLSSLAKMKHVGLQVKCPELQ